MEHTAETHRYDRAVRRRSVRYGRQKGITIFIPAAELRKAGFNPDAEPPWYLTRGVNGQSKGRRVMVNLYDEGD